MEAGYNVQVGYYDQENQNLDDNNTVLEELWSTYPNMNEVDIRSTLAAFRFLYEDTEKKVSVLSGGERARLTLAKLMLSKINLLVLDEPTNHLDINSREALEEAVEAFDGTVVTVSHDRYFIERLATRVIELIPATLGGGTYDYTDSTNIGALFRSAAALNMDAVLVTPTCCDPLCRRAVRVSMGTVFQVPWTRIGEEHTDWPHPGIDRLRTLGFKTAAMALSDDSVSIDDARLAAEEKLAIILGTEGDGLSLTTIADCDYTVRIPMSHGVDSLNVAAAGAVAFWQLGKR